tara:strand:+ start:365 stop:1042 length:678 start_codon:yes stop_codon:yes gene_type:complete
MANFKTIMIRNPEDPLSNAYSRYCATSWRSMGFDIKSYTAITPETLDQQSGLTFDESKRTITDTEKACFYSQYNLWKKCALEQVPILVLEHDAFLKNSGPINYNPNFMVQFFGQHAMEAVLYHPVFAHKLIRHCKSNAVTGPMNLVDNLIGYLKFKEQSRYGLPHARYIGPLAPVVSVIDESLGTTVDHNTGKTTTTDRLKGPDRDLFKIVDLRKAGYYTVDEWI